MVYRTLATLEEYKLISRIQASGGLARFEKGRNNRHHMVWTVCNTIDDFTWDSFDQMPLPSTVAGWGSVAAKKCCYPRGQHQLPGAGQQKKVIFLLQ